MDYDAFDRNATKMAKLAEWAYGQAYPPTILEVCHRAHWDAPVSHSDLRDFFARCETWGIRHNMANEPICKNLLAELPVSQ